MLFATAAVIFSAAVLLPEYVRWRETEYARLRAEMRVEALEAYAAAREKLIAELPHDPVLTERIAVSQGLFRPRRAQRAWQPGEGAPPPYAILPPEPDYPPPPSDALMEMGRKVRGEENRSLRRGLVLSAGLLAVLAVLLSGPGPRSEPEPD